MSNVALFDALNVIAKRHHVKCRESGMRMYILFFSYSKEMLNEIATLCSGWKQWTKIEANESQDYIAVHYCYGDR